MKKWAIIGFVLAAAGIYPLPWIGAIMAFFLQRWVVARAVAQDDAKTASLGRLGMRVSVYSFVFTTLFLIMPMEL